MSPGKSSLPKHADEEIAALIETLHRTGERLEELTAGEVDTVADRDGHTFLLRHAQEELRHSEAAKQAAILNALPAHIALLDAQGRIVSVNEAWRRFAGANALQNPECGVGVNYLDVCDSARGADAAEAQRAAAGIRSVLAGTATSFSMEYRCHSPTEERWFLMNVTPLAEDRLHGAVVMHLNITERKRAEVELCESEARFRSLTAMSSDFYWESDTEHRLTARASANRKRSTVSVFQKGAQIGERRWEIPHLSPDEAGWLAHRAMLDAHLPFRDFELSRRGTDGEERFIAISGDPVFDALGTFKGYRGVGTDITERRQAAAALRTSEREQRQLAEQLELERSRLLAAQLVARVGSWETDLATMSVIWSDETHRIFETDPATFRPTHQGFLRLIHPEDRARVDEAFGRSLDQRAASAIEHRLLMPDGRIKFVEERWLMSFDMQDKPVRAIGTCQDITERKEAEIRIKRLNRVYAVLSDINSLIVRARDRDELFQGACRIAVEAGAFKMAWIGVIDPKTLEGKVVAWYGGEEGYVEKVRLTARDGTPDSERPACRALRLSQVVICNDFAAEPAMGPLLDELVRRGHKSVACFPLSVAGRPEAVIALFAGEADVFDEEEVKLLNELAGDIAFAIDHMQKRERLNYLAYYDVLTGLANRSLFLERVAQYIHSAASGGHKLALFLTDLERFKNINDSLGRQAGDALLRQVAEWMTRIAGDANLVARVGADVFAVVLPEVRQDGDLARMLEKMIEAFLEHPFHLNDAIFRIAAKGGVALFPDDGADADTLFRNAEAALKEAKARGERYLFYTQTMTAAVAGNLTLENQLRQALDNEEFVLHYQPKVNLASGKLTGAEALIRWNDPRTGLVPPGRFIPILEETGLIYDVGRWALRQAIADYLRWRAAGLPAVRIAVNVSPLQLRNRGFVAEIGQLIGIDAQAPAGLEIEITESLIMADIKLSIASLQAIRALGIRLAIDDFGTGFSSLSYLAKLPVDTLKIDRSFVIEMTASPEGLALVSTIIKLAHSLKFTVVAEGVETGEQARLLRLLDCDEMQGFLFSKPVPGEIFATRFLAPAGATPPALIGA